MDTKNKLARAITAEELTTFLDHLANTAGVDGPMIQRLAQERFGVEIGHNSANHFRKDVYQRYLERLQKRKQLAHTVSSVADKDSGRTLADAAADELSQQVFEFLADNELDLSDEDDLKRADTLSRILKSARSEDRKLIDSLTQQNDRLATAAAAATQSAKTPGGLSATALTALEDALNFRKPQSAS